jgi:hypothetical protein
MLIQAPINSNLSVLVFSKKVKFFRYLVLCIFILSILKSIERLFEINLPLLRYSIVLAGAYFIVFHLLDFKEAFEHRYKGLIAFFVFIVLIFVFYSLMNGFDELFAPSREYLNFKAFIGNNALLFLFPFLLFLQPLPQYWNLYLKFAYILLLLLVPLFLIDLPFFISREKSPEGIIRTFAGASGFLLLISPYLNSRKKNIILFVFLLSLFFMLFHARRNMVLYFGLFFTFYYYLVFFSNTDLVKMSKLKIIFNTFLLGLVGVGVFLFSNPDFSLFFERAATGLESKEGIIDEFLMDVVPFESDFYFGRGMYGTFFSKHLGMDEDGTRAIGGGQRDLIENGYLQIILNFGFIFLGSFILLSLIGFYKGFFNSKNLFVKACAAVLFINLIDMIGWGLPQLSFRYLSVWLCFPFCFSMDFRILSDVQIKQLIFFGK